MKVSLRGRRSGENPVGTIFFPRTIFRNLLNFLVEEAFRVEGVHEDATWRDVFCWGIFMLDQIEEDCAFTYNITRNLCPWMLISLHHSCREFDLPGSRESIVQGTNKVQLLNICGSRVIIHRSFPYVRQKHRWSFCIIMRSLFLIPSIGSGIEKPYATTKSVYLDCDCLHCYSTGQWKES
jgi:hypothetical protein